MTLVFRQLCWCGLRWLNNLIKLVLLLTLLVPLQHLFSLLQGPLLPNLVFCLYLGKLLYSELLLSSFILIISSVCSQRNCITLKRFDSLLSLFDVFLLLLDQLMFSQDFFFH